MATGTSSPPPLPADTPANRLVDERLARVGASLKSSDIGGGVMLMIAGLLTIVLVLVFVDHWVVGLSIWARCLGLLSLLAWVGFCTAQWVLPGAFSRINPAYSAQLIERSRPGLRNSLLNYILLREQRGQLKEPVFRELEHRATAQVQTIDAEAAVDRHQLIRIALVSATLLFLFGLYTALSPKSPISTLARLMLPWKSIDRPSRVRVLDVRPGTATVYAGQPLEVSARVERSGNRDPVRVVYSTVDQQLVDQVLPMHLDEATGRHTVILGQRNQGIRTDLDYRIEAGDAVAGPFRVIVSPLPSMVVERVDYEYPAYTKLTNETVEGEGDIRAVEGTRVRIHAVANQPISSAYLEFDPDAPERGTRRTIRMKLDGNKASVSFRLRLREDRRTQIHRSYHLRFLNAADETNAVPIQHRIDIDPDLPPLVEVLSPTEIQTDVPLDGAERIEIRGLDPDFGLSDITLHGVARGERLFEPRSLLGETSHGQVVRRLTFRPARFNLREGDTVEIWATGFDNRFNVFEQTAAPNMALPTQRYRLRITAPTGRTADPPPPDQPPQAGQPNDGSGDGQPNPTDEGNGEGQSDQPADGQHGNSANADEASDPQNGRGPAQQDPAGNAAGQPGQGDESQQQSDGGEEPPAADAGEGEAGQQQDDPSRDGTAPENGSSGPSDQEAEPGPSDSRTSSGEGDSANAENGRSPTAAGAEDRDSPSPGEGHSTSEPLPSDGNSDGDAFERVLDRMRELHGENSDGTPKTDSEANQSTPPGDDGARDPSSTSTDRGDDAERDHQASGETDGPDRHQDPGGESESSPSGEGEQTAAAQDAAESSEPPSSGQPREPDDAEPGGGEGDQSHDSGPEQPGQEGQGARQQNRTRESSDDSSGDEATGAPGDERQDGAPAPSDEAAGESGESQGEPTDQGREGSDSSGQGGTKGSQPDQPGAGQNPGDERGAQGQPPAGNESAGEAGESAASDAQPGQSPDGQPSGDSSAAGTEPGDSPGGDPPDSSTSGGSGSEEGQPSPPAASDPAGGEASGGGPPQGGSGPNAGATELPNEEDEPGESGGDDPNLEYARKATDLALEYLTDQQHDPDPDLLERLGWTPDQLRQFIQRWESLRREAVAPQRRERGERDDQPLDDALRSLGLFPAADRLQRGDARDDQLPGVRDAGVRTAPPAEYEGPYKEFMRRRGKRRPAAGPRR